MKTFIAFLALCMGVSLVTTKPSYSKGFKPKPMPTSTPFEYPRECNSSQEQAEYRECHTRNRCGTPEETDHGQPGVTCEEVCENIYCDDDNE